MNQPASEAPFGRALGLLLARGDGLSAAYLPEGLKEKDGRAIVTAANEARPADPPFAILVRSGPADDRDATCLAMAAPAAISYRQGDRLAVVVGRQPGLESFVQSFRQVLGQGFPGDVPPDEGPGISLGRVAEALLKVAIQDAGLSADDAQLAGVAGIMRSALAQSAAAHEALGQGTDSWNVYWYRHVEIAVSALSRALRARTQMAPSEDLAATVTGLVYAAFGLPRPVDGHALDKGRPTVGKRIAAALDAWWTDETTIVSTIQQLVHHPDTEGGKPHPLREVDWSKFDRRLAGLDNQLLAFVSTITQTPDGVDACASLTEAQFFNPFGADTAHLALSIEDLEGNSLDIGEGAVSIFAIPGAREERNRQHLWLVTETIRLVIGTQLPVTAEQVVRSKATVACSDKYCHWDGVLAVDEAGRLVATGAFRRRLSVAMGGFRKGFAVRLERENEDSLAQAVPPQGTATAVILPVGEPSVLWLRSTGSKLAGSSVGQFPEDGSALVVDVEGGQDLDLIVWGGGSDIAPPELDGERLVRQRRDRLWSERFSPGGSNTLIAGDRTVEFCSPEPDNPTQSPVIAAIWKRSISSRPISEGTQRSLRGALETNLLMSVESPLFVRALGHVVMPADPAREASLADLVPAVGGSVFMDAGLAHDWNAVSDFSVSAALVESAEAERFRTAFAGLGIADRVRVHRAKGQTHLWPSQAAWRSVWNERDTLDEYLEAYCALVAVARQQGDPGGVFWACYPFSASVWGITGADSGTVRAVLLSPLHPIRLAWLASAEAALWDAEGAARLAGAIEGWNFPLIGPRPTRTGRMLAVPTDNGEDQVFLGWSMLLAASVDGAAALTAPSRAGSYDMPGSSATGLNAGAVEGALRDYKRVNPHVSTLTVDLAAPFRAARVGEIDDAVLEALERWSSDDESPGRWAGIRVRDSLHRLGDAPRDEVGRLIAGDLGAPLAWGRYEPELGHDETCNIRLLEDAGVRFEIRQQLPDAESFGLAGAIPLRRFEAVPPEIAAAEVLSRPSLSPGPDGASFPFTRAVCAVEDGHGSVQIVASLHHSKLVAENADWTVSGESRVSASALATLVGKVGDGTRMLWEWRPPFFDGAGGRSPVQLERRPFISVVRVSGGFHGQLQLLISELRGREASPDDVQELLFALGSRGVGLSSLTAMGGTHAAGALGFFLTMRMMDFVGNGKDPQVVLPIDACDPFLTGLANTDRDAGLTRRADLLIVRIHNDSLVLVPIEIKLYGLKSEHPAAALPQPTAAALADPLEQLTSTARVLRRVEEASLRYQEGHEPAEAALWHNGLAALLEAGCRLQDRLIGDPVALRDRLEAIIRGGLPVVAGRPVLCYLGHGAHASGGGSFHAHTNQDRSAEGFIAPFGAFMANPGALWGEIDEGGGEALSAWSRVIEWAAAVPDQEGSLRPLSPSDHPWPLGTTDLRPDQMASDTAGPEPTSVAESAAPVVQDLDMAVNAASANAGSEPLTAPAAGGLRSGEEDGVRFDVGQFRGSLGHAAAEYWPSNTALNQMNIGVVGDLGTGKTQLLRSLMINLRQGAARAQNTPISMLVFDYKRDYQDDSFLAAAGGVVLHPYRIPLNVFALSGEYTPRAAFLRAQAFIDILAKIYKGIGPVQKNGLSAVITDLYATHGGRPPTLRAVLDSYRANVDPADSVVSLLNRFVMGEVFSDDPDELLSFDVLIKDRVLIVALNDFETDVDMKNAVVTLFLNMYYEYMQGLEKRPVVERSDGVKLRTLNSFLLVDEATNIMQYEFPVLMELMLQGREFGVGTILASQYLSHFKDHKTNYGEPLLTWFIHKVPSVSKGQLLGLGFADATDAMAADIAVLEVHEAIYASLGVSGRVIRGTPSFELALPDYRAATG